MLFVSGQLKTKDVHDDTDTHDKEILFNTISEEVSLFRPLIVTSLEKLT